MPVSQSHVAMFQLHHWPLSAAFDAGCLPYCMCPLCVQVNPSAGPLVSTPPDVIDKIFDINVKTALLLVQEAVPHMQRGGRIVLISSVTAFQ